MFKLDLVLCDVYEQGGASATFLAQWAELVSSCCSEEQPAEVKLMAAEVLVSCTDSVLTSAGLPLGESDTESCGETSAL